MTYVRGPVCRESGRGIAQAPVHVREHCFGPLEVKNDAVCHPTWSFCITGSGRRTVEALEPRLSEPIRVGASLSAVEAVLPELQAITTR